MVLSDELKGLIDESKVISFDVFDTLIRRVTDEPETVFDIVGKQYGINDFRKIRTGLQMKASMQAEKNGRPHANLDEIYDFISQNTSYELDWNEVKETELQVELDSVYCNDELMEVFNYAKMHNKRVIITSDMYLNAKQISRMLEKCGYTGYAALYVSAD